MVPTATTTVKMGSDGVGGGVCGAYGAAAHRRRRHRSAARGAQIKRCSSGCSNSGLFEQTIIDEAVGGNIRCSPHIIRRSAEKKNA